MSLVEELTQTSAAKVDALRVRIRSSSDDDLGGYGGHRLVEGLSSVAMMERQWVGWTVTGAGWITPQTIGALWMCMC